MSWFSKEVTRAFKGNWTWESWPQATLELLDKWGKHYEMLGAPPHSGGGKIAQTWRDLMKVGAMEPDEITWF